MILSFPKKFLDTSGLFNKKRNFTLQKGNSAIIYNNTGIYIHNNFVDTAYYLEYTPIKML